MIIIIIFTKGRFLLVPLIVKHVVDDTYLYHEEAV